MDDDMSAEAVVFPGWRVSLAWAEWGMVALIALLGVQEGRFAWAVLGLAVVALVLVVAALTVGARALRRSGRALDQLSAHRAGGFHAGPVGAWQTAEDETAESEPLESEAPPVSSEDAAVSEVAAPKREPAPSPAAPQPPEPSGPEPVPNLEVLMESPSDTASALRSVPASAGRELRDPQCTCGHRDSVHLPRTGTDWRMCLGDQDRSCSCRHFTPQGDEVGTLLRALRHPDPFVRIGAAARLRGVPEAEPVLVQALFDDHKMVRVEVARGLRDARGTAARQALVAAVAQDPDRDVRLAAVEALTAWIQRPQPGSNGG